MTEKRAPGWGRIAVALALLAAAAVGVRWGFRDQLDPKAAAALLRSVEERSWALPAFVAVYLGFTSAFVPAMWFHMISGAVWGFRLGLALNLIAFNAVANLHFWAARKLGREKVTALLQRFGLRRLEEQTQRAGLLPAIAIRVVPLPTMVANITGGISPMRWPVYALGTFLGSIPWIVIYTYFAAALVAGVEGAGRRSFIQATIASAVVLLGTVVSRAWAKRRRNFA